jgi:O-antigen ligase
VISRIRPPAAGHARLFRVPHLSPPMQATLYGAAVIGVTLLLIPALSSGKAFAVLLSVVAGLVAVYMACRPHTAVLAIFVFWFFDVNLTGVKYFNVPYLLAGLLMLPLAIQILRDPSLTPLRVPQLKIYLAIGLVLVAAIGWSTLVHPDPPPSARDHTSRQFHLFITRLVFLVFVLYFIRTTRHIKQTMFVLVFLIAIAAIDALLPMLRGEAVGRIRGSTGLTTNANRLAFVSVFATCVIWFFREFAAPSRWKQFTAPLLLLLPMTVLLTASRNGLLQLLVLGGMGLKEQRHWSPTRRLYSFLFVLAIVAVVLVAVPSAHLLRATSFDPTAVRPGQDSLRNRLTTVVAALHMTAENPLFGVGPGNFLWRHQAFWGNPQATHNSYLWALTGGGPLLLGLYLLLFFRTHRMIRRAEASCSPDLLWVAKALRVNVILFMVFSAFADFWLTEWLYLLVGLAVALHRVSVAPHPNTRGVAPRGPMVAPASAMPVGVSR